MKNSLRIALGAVTIATIVAGITGCQAPAEHPGAHSSPSVSIDANAPLGPQVLAAIQQDDSATLEALIAAGADVNEDLGADSQAIHAAAFGSRSALIPILVAAGADVDARAAGDSTALMLAADRADGATVRALLDAGADPYLADALGFETTAIHRAGREGNVEALRALVEHGVDVNLLESTMAHALMYAAFNGELEAVEYLIEVGSDLEQRDDAGKTAYEWAVERGQDAVAQALAAAGADTDGP
jgi:ankyrin repeat protein